MKKELEISKPSQAKPSQAKPSQAKHNTSFLKNSSVIPIYYNVVVRFIGQLLFFVIFIFFANNSFGEYKFVTKWGSLGSGDGQFSTPWGVALDSSGNVYVAEYGNHRIQKFNSSGTFITKWGSFGTGDGQFNYPYGVAVDSSGNVYVSDQSNHRIQKFNSNGTFITKWGSNGSGDGQFSTPFGVTVDSSGNVYVADKGNSRIQKFNSSGTFITKWGSVGSGDGQFNQPTGIAVDSSGNVYVNDPDNSRIQKFNSSGTFITKLGSGGSGDGQFSVLYGVAVDSSGNVYVADGYNYRIQKFNSNGTFITKWGSNGSGDGQFSIPYGVAVDSSGNVYVAEYGNHRVQKFTEVISKDTTETQTVEATDGSKTKIVIPPGSLAQDVKIVITRDATITDGIAYNFQITDATTGNEVENFLNPVTITIYYTITNGKVTNTNVDQSDAASKLSIYYYDRVKWNKQKSEIYTINKFLSISTTHASIYAIKAVTDVSTYYGGEVVVTPNPFTPNNDGVNDSVSFYFDNPNNENTTIKIFRRDGLLVRTLENITSWDGKDDNGDNLESGLYLWQLEIGGVVKKRGTVILAR